MTHNFRPIQPTGDREVYFVTSSSDIVSGKEDAPLEEPLQQLDQSNSIAKQEIMSTTTISATNDNIDNQIDSHAMNEQERNEVEATTIAQNQSQKASENHARSATQSACWLIVGSLLLFSSNYFKDVI